MAQPYVTLAAVKARLGIANVTDDAVLQTICDQVNGFVESFTGRIPAPFGTGSTFGDSMSSGHFTDSLLTVPVPALTIEDFMERYRITDLNFIKMDIEAGETEVLPAMKDFLGRTRTTMFVSLHPLWFPRFVEDSGRILDALSCYRYMYSKSGAPLNTDVLARRLKSRLIQDIVVSDRPWKA